MPSTLDYHRPARNRTRPDVPWYRTNIFTTLLTAAVILGVNLYLVGNGNKGWGFWLAAFLLMPLANAALALVCLAFTPLVRRLTGASAAAHVYVTLYGCGAATILDAVIILIRSHAC